MKIKELLEKLQKADLESEVVFNTDKWLMSVLIVEETTAQSEDWDVKFCILKEKPDEEDF